MADTFVPNWPPSQINAEFTHKASVGSSVGDLLYWDSVNSVVAPFSQLADLGTAALMQGKVARLFMGVANSKQLSSDATARNARVLIDGVWEFACDSGTFAIGDYVGASYNTNILRDQQVAKVSFPHLAIGRVVKVYAAAATKVKCRLMSRYLLGIGDRFAAIGASQGQGATVLADSTAAVTIDMGPILTCVPTAARTKNLPSETASTGLKFYFTNQSAGANTVTFKDSAGSATIVAVAQNKSAILWCDGTTWFACLGS